MHMSEWGGTILFWYICRLGGMLLTLKVKPVLYFKYKWNKNIWWVNLMRVDMTVICHDYSFISVTNVFIPFVSACFSWPLSINYICVWRVYPKYIQAKDENVFQGLFTFCCARRLIYVVLFIQTTSRKHQATQWMEPLWLDHEGTSSCSD